MINIFGHLDRSLIPDINHQVTEPLIETVNSISQSILPVMITQALVQAAKEESDTTKTGFSIHDAMNGDMIDEFQYLDVERQNPLTKPFIDEEDEEENEQFPRPLDYIDVSDQGTISNATRLDSVLKEREKHDEKLVKQDSSALSHADISYFFDTNIPAIQREILLMKFEVPSSTSNQLMGALTALNILMENDQLTGNMMTGESFNYPILDVADDIVIGIDDISVSIYNDRRAINEDIGLGTSPTSHQRSLLEACINPVESTGCPLPEGIRQLIQNLVYLSLQPMLEEWATAHHRWYPLNIITETKANEIYTDVIHWVYTRAKLAEQQHTPNEKQSSEDDFNSSDIDSSSSDEFGLVSVHKQSPRRRPHQKDPLTFTSAQSSRRSRSNLCNDIESNSDSEGRLYSDGDQRRAKSIQPCTQRRKVESAAERMGETRRKGEHLDLDDTLSVSYASEHYLGFSSRALVLLNSLIRYGMTIHILPSYLYLLTFCYSICKTISGTGCTLYPNFTLSVSRPYQLDGSRYGMSWRIVCSYTCSCHSRIMFSSTCYPSFTRIKEYCFE